MSKPRTAVIGLGSMGMGMARSLRRAGFPVVGTDISDARCAMFADDGGEIAPSAREAAMGADIVVSVVITGGQTETLLFGPHGLAATLHSDAVFVSCATMPAGQARDLGKRAADAGFGFLDAPISGGARGAENAALTVMSSGPRAAFDAARPALDAMGKRIFWMGEAPGLGSAMKTVNQLLAGVNLATACEAIAFAIRLGLDPRQVDEIISGSAGNSWMWGDRISALVQGDMTPRSAVDIFTKDLGIVLDTARASNFPAPMAAAGLQGFLMAAARGWGRDADSSVARVYAELAGLTLPQAAND
ncbi:MAG: NAD(P)-dependent oxidoreductase [Alphaproteobacteria bacterium]